MGQDGAASALSPQTFAEAAHRDNARDAGDDVQACPRLLTI